MERGNAAMKFRQISLCCECGRAPSRIEKVGLTAEHQLVFHWQCSACKKMVYIVKDLADCWNDCPEREDPSSVKATDGRFDYRTEDAKFLRKMGFKS